MNAGRTEAPTEAQDSAARSFAFPRTQMVDQLVTGAARVFLAEQIRKPFSVLAVGGYGRGELFPYSDVDLIVLFDEEPEPDSVKDPLGNFLRVLWDSSLKASHSVRTIAECCRYQEANLPLHISLLDVRLLFGSAKIFQTLESRLSGFYRRQGGKLLQHLARMAEARHAKFGDTVQHLEPNIKEGPGGIRDLHFLHWASLLTPDKEPVRHAAAQAERARNFLYSVRFFLHEQSGRDNNVLTFELQDRAAAFLASPPVPPEEWMRKYYGNARTCFEPTSRALESIGRDEAGLGRHLLDRRDKLSNADFTVLHNRVFLRHPAATLSSFASLFTLFNFVGRQGIALSSDAQRRVEESIPRLTGETASKEFVGWDDWQELLRQPHAGLALREMRNARLLSALLPEWEGVENLVVRDFYHRYTVDEHTLVAIEAIDRLINDREGSPGRLQELAREESDLALLRTALLLHDTGKGTTPGDHLRGSAFCAERFLESAGAPRLEAEMVHFLIAHHLDLSLVMTSRDLEDPATARFLTSKIGTLEQLRALTLLTYADVSAVNPTAMTPWRIEQLWRAYSLTYTQLTRELAASRIHYPADAPVTTLMRPELARFLEGFPTRYLRMHTPEQIEQHFSLEQVKRQDGFALEIRREPGTYGLTVLVTDQTGLFASLCGTLAAFGMNIIKAEAASNAHGSVLVEFRFEDPARTLELNPDEVERLQWNISCVIEGSLKASELLKRRRRFSRPRVTLQPKPTVHFDNAASDHSTLIELTAEDRPGLLFEIASVLTAAGCNIEVVLVNTEAHRALDVLYVTNTGEKLDQSLQDELQRQLLGIVGGANI